MNHQIGFYDAANERARQAQIALILSVLPEAGGINARQTSELSGLFFNDVIDRLAELQQDGRVALGEGGYVRR